MWLPEVRLRCSFRASPPRRPGSVAGDFIVLNGPCRSQHGRIPDGIVLGFLHNLFGFLNDAVDGRTFLATCLLPNKLKYLIEALHLPLGSWRCRVKVACSFRELAFFTTLWQSLEDSLLRLVDVLERLFEKFAECV